MALSQFTSLLVVASENTCPKPHKALHGGKLQPIGNFHTNPRLLSYPSQEREALGCLVALPPVPRPQARTTTHSTEKASHTTHTGQATPSSLPSPRPLAQRPSNRPCMLSMPILMSSSPISLPRTSSCGSELRGRMRSVEARGTPPSPSMAVPQESVSATCVIRRTGQSGSNHRSKVKLNDFDVEFHSTIHLACRYYRVLLCTHQPFPLEHDQDRYMHEAWHLACTKHEVNHKASNDVLNLVRSFGLFFLRRTVSPDQTAQ
jgi:hypothetical protein